VLTGDDNCRSKADALFTALLPSAAENVFGHLSLLNALDLHLSGAEIVVVGEGARADALLATARKLPHGTSIVLHAPSADVLPCGLAQDIANAGKPVGRRNAISAFSLTGMDAKHVVKQIGRLYIFCRVGPGAVRAPTLNGFPEFLAYPGNEARVVAHPCRNAATVIEVHAPLQASRRRRRRRRRTE
jgi:hypothetical protein